MPLPLFEDWLHIFEDIMIGEQPTIGVGLIDPSKVAQEELEAVRSLFNIIIVGKDHYGHEDRVSQHPELDLVQMLKEGEIQGIVKVDVGGVKLRNTYMEVFGKPHLNRGSLVSFNAKKPNSEDFKERTAMIFPVSPEEGATCLDRLQGINEAKKELHIFVQEKLHVGLLSLCRPETARDWSYEAESRRSHEAALWLEEQLEASDDGTTAKNYGIELEKALQESDIISPVGPFPQKQYHAE